MLQIEIPPRTKAGLCSSNKTARGICGMPYLKVTRNEESKNTCALEGSVGGGK